MFQLSPKLKICQLSGDNCLFNRPYICKEFLTYDVLILLLLFRTSEDVDIVNMEGSTYDRSTFRDQSKDLKHYMKLMPNAIRYPRYEMTKCYAYYWLGTVLSELPYGLIVDILLRLSRQKPR